MDDTMKVFGLSEAYFESFLEFIKTDISPVILCDFRECFQQKDSIKFIHCISNLLITSSSLTIKVASCFSPILLACFKQIDNKLQLFLLLSKLCPHFEVAKTYLYRWISVSTDFSNDELINLSNESKNFLQLIEAYYTLLHYDTTFFKRHLPISRIMILFSDIVHLDSKVNYFQWLLYSIVKTISPKAMNFERFKNIQPDEEATLRKKLYKLLPKNCYNFVKPIIFYDEIKLNHDDYLHFWDDSFGSKIISVSGILFERINHSEVKPFIPNRQYDFIVLPSIQDSFQELASAVAFGIPVLLEGPIACGKTSMITHLAKFTGRFEIPDIVSVQISDQVDTKFLLGSYVCNDRPGEFSFNLGPLLRAIQDGNWIVLEDINSASPEVITLLQSIIENQSIASISGYENKIRGFNPDFRIFFTRRILNSSSAETGSGRTVIRLLEKMCKSLCLPEVSEKEVELLISEKWPVLKQYGSIFAQIFFSIRKEELIGHTGSGMQRHVCLRDLFKCCARFSKDPESLKNEKNIFLNLSELFVHFSDSSEFAIKKAHVIGNFINIDKNTCEYLLSVRKPDFQIDRNILRIGRGIVNRSCDNSNIQSQFAFTDESLQLLERLLCSSVIGSEPVLLCGETGVGKTSCVQYLADLLQKKLTVINMNQQSDSVELFGGYKPINIKFLMEPLCETFMSTLTPSFKENNRDIFLKSFNNHILNGEWEEVIQGIDSIITLLSKKKSFKKTKEQWVKVQEMLETVKAHINTKSELIFGFVDGSLTRAMKLGEWILLDEINLAESETLQSLLSLFENSNTVSLFEKANNQSFKTHPDFRLFACMNPATDVGKRSLPIGIQSRFTEFYIHEMIDETALRILVETYLGNLFDTKIIDFLVKFYLNIKKDASTLLKDLNGHRPIYSLRNLCRALRIACQNPFNNAYRSLYESLILAFLTNLDQESCKYVRAMIEQKIFKNSKTHLQPIAPKSDCISVEGFPVPIGNQTCEPEDGTDYIQTKTVIENKKNICRILSAGKTLPILLQGETSVGKTSMIKFLAKITGHTCLRVNNHEHTDIQDYIGAYAADENGKLVFKEGVLAKAMREGAWLILDELNLAPTDVLEALNRVLDDNRELFIPETKQLIKAHPQFTLFATQNPPGKYGGRKMLSRAFRNRFIELNFTEFTSDQLEEILQRRCKLSQSYAKKMVSVMVKLQKFRSRSDIFAGKNGLITLRDLFRWGERYSKFSKSQDGLYDWKEFLALQGYYLLAGRSRNPDECDYIRKILSEEFQHEITDEKAFYQANFEQIKEKQLEGIVWTRAFKRLGVLIEQSILYGEPILLVGETGCGKTTICQYFSKSKGIELKTLNCHQNTECADFLGSYRPNRGEDLNDESLFRWEDGPLVHAVKRGYFFLIDEISLADDSVLERLNSLFEPERKLYMTESTGKQEEIIAANDFRCFATMNPGGDFGKRELSPAFRDRFTEIWCPTYVDRSDIISIIIHNLSGKFKHESDELKVKTLIANLICLYLESFNRNILNQERHFHFSIRDILTWTNFINRTCDILSLKMAFIHGARIVCVDSLGTRVIQRSLEESKRLSEELLENFAQQLDEFSKCNEHMEIDDDENLKDYFCIEPFKIPIGPKNYDNGPEFYFADDSQVKDNLVRVMRALQLEKPILLEGPPGVGKTSMIEALAKFAGYNLIRINLSEQTDISDLFGSDLPMEGSDSCAKFVFCEGPLLKALKTDQTWILFDEMNLASQTVLEGLNACLDHRGEIFIPELNRKFIVNRQSTRIFASQNPCSMDGSRKGLPKSFLNRFTVVFMDQLADRDCQFALHKLYPDLSLENINSMISLNRNLLDCVQKDSTFARLGGPFEFNLRDLTRWGQVTISGYSVFGSFLPEMFVDLIYTNKMRCESDRQKIRSLNNQNNDNIKHKECAFYMDEKFLQIGYSFLERTCIQASPKRFFLFRRQFEALQSAIKCIEQNWLTIFIGGPGSGKTHLVKALASVSGRRLITISANNEMDINDLLGGFEQKNIENDFRLLQNDLITFIHDNFINLIINDNKVWYLLRDCQNDSLSKLQTIQKMSLLLESITFKEPFEAMKMKLYQKICNLMKIFSEDSDIKQNGSFEWMDSKLIRAVQDGHWLLIDNANLLNASVLDRLNSLFEKNGTLIINEKGSNCEPIYRHSNFRAFLTMDPLNGELSRAMKNRGIEIVLPELLHEDGIELCKKFSISPEDCGIALSEENKEKTLICKEFFDNFSLLALKSQFGQQSKLTTSFSSSSIKPLTLNSFSHSISKYQMPFSLSDYIIESKIYEIYRDGSIIKSGPKLIQERLFLEHSSGTKIDEIIRRKFISSRPASLQLSLISDFRENPYLLYKSFQHQNEQVSHSLTEYSLKNICNAIFEPFKSKINNCSLKQFSRVSFNELFKAIYCKFYESSNLALCQTEELISSLLYSEQLLEICQECIDLKPILAVYRLAPVLELLQKSFETIFNDEFSESFTNQKDVFNQFSIDITKTISLKSFNHNWPTIMANIQNYSKLNYFQTNNSESTEKLINFDCRAQLDTVMKNCSISNIPEESSQFIQGSELFFATLIIKRLLNGCFTDNKSHDADREFFEQILKFFDEKLIKLSPTLLELVKLYEYVYSSPDLMCFLFEFIQNNLSISHLCEYFSIDNDYNLKGVGNSITFEHFPVIPMTLFNAVQLSQNISVKNYLLNRSTLDFYHCFMIQNYSWLKNDACSDFGKDYLFLSLNYDKDLENFENDITDVGLQLFKFGKTIISKTCLSALPFDPRERQIAIQSNWNRLYEFISNERRSRLEYYRFKYGYSGENFHSKFGQDLEQIYLMCSERLQSQEPDIVSRKNPEKFLDLIRDVQEFENNQLNEEKFNILFKNLQFYHHENYDLSRLILEFSNIQSVIVFFANQLRLKYFDFYDIIIAYLWGLWIMAKGAQEIVFALKNDHQNNTDENYEALFNFQTSESSHKIAEMCSNLRLKYRSSFKDSQEETCLSLSSLMECQNSFAMNFDINSKIYKYLINFTESFLQQWKNERETIQDEELKRNALFHMKLGDNDPKDEEDAFRQEFPSCDKEFEDLMNDFHVMGDSLNIIKEKSDQISKKNISNELHIALVRVHLSIESYKNILDLERIDFTSAYLKRFKALQNFIRQQFGCSIGKNFEHSLVDGLLIASDHIQQLDSDIENNLDPLDQTRILNVYKYSPYSEVKKCFDLVHCLRLRICEIIEQIDEHPTLKRMLEIIDRFSNLKINSPLLTFSAGLELLLKTLEEWQSFAHREIRMLDFIESITQIVSQWRSLEIKFWNSSLESVHEKIDEKELQEYWFKFLAQIDNEIKIDDDYNYNSQSDEEFLKLLKYFLELSNIGQFNIRMKILDSLCFYLNSLSKNDKRKKFIKHIISICAFYRHFKIQIDKAIQYARQPIEKELKDLVKISSWTPKNFWSMKENLKNTHRQLFNLKRKYEQLLQRKSHEIFATSQESIQNSLSSNWSKIRNDNFKLEPLKFLNELHLLTTFNNEKLSDISIDHYLKRCQEMSYKIENGCKNFLIPLVKESDDFNQIVREEIKELSLLKPKEDPLKDIEKWKKSIGLIQTRKRRALGELFKELKFRELSYQKGLINFDELTIDNIMLKYGLDMRLNLFNNNWNCQDLSLKKWSNNCDDLLHHCATLYMQFGAIIEKPNEEITFDYLNRIKGFGKSMFLMILEKRKKLSSEIKYFDKMSSYIEVFIENEKNSLNNDIYSIDEYHSIINDIIDIYERFISFIIRLKMIENILQKNFKCNNIDNFKRIQMNSDILMNYEQNSSISIDLLNEIQQNIQNDFEKMIILKKLPFFTVYDRSFIENSLKSIRYRLEEIEIKFKNAKNFKNIIEEFEIFKMQFKNLEDKIQNSNSILNQEDSVLFDKIIKKFLFNIECVYKNLLKMKNFNKLLNHQNQSSEDTIKLSATSATAKEVTHSSFQHHSLFELLKQMNSEMIYENLMNFFNKIQNGQISFTKVQIFGRFFQQYLSVYRLLLELSFTSLSSNLSFCITLLNLFNQLIINGFCKPEEPQPNEDNDKIDLNDMKNTGFGDGDTTGAEDVSDRLDCQDQLDELKKQEKNNEDGQNNDDDDDQDIKDEKNGLEMDDDFDAKEFGPDDNKDQNDENEEEEENEKDEDEELDDKMGNVEDDDECLDENLWGDEEDNNLDDLENSDDTKGKESLDKQTVANENDEITDKPENESNIEEKVLSDEEDEENNEQMNDDYKNEEANQIPDDVNENETNDKSQMELPDQIDLDQMDDLDSDGEDQDQDDKVKEETEEEEKENDEAKMEEDILDESERADLEKDDNDDDNNIANDETNDTNNNVNTEQKEDEENREFLNENNQNILNSQKNSNFENLTNNEIQAQQNDNDSQEKKNDENQKECGEIKSNLENDRTTSAMDIQGHEDDMDQTNDEVSLQKDRSSKRTLAEEVSSAKRQKILPTNDEESLKNREQFKSETVKHVDNADKADDVAMDSAITDDLEQQKIDENDSQNSSQIKEEQMDVEEQDRLEVNEEKRSSQRRQAKNDQLPLPKKKDKDNSEICEITGEFAQTFDVKPEAKSSFHQGNFNMERMLEGNVDLKLETVPIAVAMNVANDEEKQKTVELFQERRQIVEPLIYELCNQLQLVLEPTKCSKFKGDYKTGKRLNMRKVIAYVASDFRKDKIWLRRSKPSKRQYQIMIAVDDSRSMDDNQSKMMAFDSLLMLGKAFSIIEAGSIGVMRYGQESEMIHSLNDPFTEESVLETFRSFTFNQTKTLYASMLDSAIGLLKNARNNSVQSVHQLLVIVSDGRGLSQSDRALQSALVRLREMNIFSVFLIIDNPEHKNSIVDLQSFSFMKGVCKAESYIEQFPFPYYVILKNVADLPAILGDSLRQWFEMVNMH